MNNYTQLCGDLNKPLFQDPVIKQPGYHGFKSPTFVAQEMANVSFGLRTLLCWRRHPGDVGTKNLDFLRIIGNSPKAKMTSQKKSSSVKQSSPKKIYCNAKPSVLLDLVLS